MHSLARARPGGPCYPRAQKQSLHVIEKKGRDFESALTCKVRAFAFDSYVRVTADATPGRARAQTNKPDPCE